MSDSSQLFPGGKGLATFTTDYRLYDEDGWINDGFITFRNNPVELTLIANNHYFHIRQEHENEVVYKNNVVSLCRDGFNPIYDVTNLDPDWEFNETQGYNGIADQTGIEPSHNTIAGYLMQPSTYHANKSLQVSDSNYGNRRGYDPFSPQEWTVLSKKLNVQIEDLFGSETVNVVSFEEERMLPVYGFVSGRAGGGSGMG